MAFVILSFSSLALRGALGQTSVDAKKEAAEAAFSVKGTIVRVDSSAQVIRVKNEGGLELTFHATDPAQMAGLSEGDEVSLEYLYNENYEKLIRSVKKTEAPPSSDQIST